VKNIVTTIPKSKFANWAAAERTCRMCDGTTERNGESPWFWLINTNSLPKDIVVGESVCFMVYDGLVRGYFNIVDTDISENWRDKHGIGKPRITKCIVLANWHPIADKQPVTGFQGYRYTPMRA
jgi:hypothetical protein